MLTNSRRVYKQIVKEQRPLAHNGGEKDTVPVIENRFGKLILGMLSMVEVNGFEPMTSCVQGRRSPS
jgi:hypothetical protein